MWKLLQLQLQLHDKWSFQRKKVGWAWKIDVHKTVHSPKLNFRYELTSRQSSVGGVKFNPWRTTDHLEKNGYPDCTEHKSRETECTEHKDGNQKMEWEKRIIEILIRKQHTCKKMEKSNVKNFVFFIVENIHVNVSKQIILIINTGKSITYSNAQYQNVHFLWTCVSMEKCLLSCPNKIDSTNFTNLALLFNAFLIR